MEVQALLEFFRKNNFPEAEFALKQDLTEKKELYGSYDFEKFLFPMNPPLPPVKLPVNSRRRAVIGPISGSGSGHDSSGDDEFKSLGSSTSVSAVCSSDFTNPYGQRSTTQADSDASSDRMSQFGTAREYNDFDMQTDLWYDDKDDGPYMTPSFGGLDPFGCPSEDKFVMTSGMVNNLSRSPFSFNRLSDDSEEVDHHYIDYPFQPHKMSTEVVDNGQVKDCYHLDEKNSTEVRIKWDLGRNGCSDREDSDSNVKETILNELEASFAKQRLSNTESVVEGNGKDLAEELDGSRSIFETYKQELLLVDSCAYDFGANDEKEVVKSTEEPSSAVDEQESTTPEDIPYWETNEDDYEVFNLRIIHRKNRTGFEESKEFPIVLHSVVAGRYYITEYLGSAAFSKVVQAHDILTGVDVCLKIIKNDKDFFDQSLDEIKLLKYVNKHDPADTHHILRLYDYFYHQEHLFIVCELLRANLYEFQKYNLESDGEAYFTMSRLQSIARQCLEALDYLHSLGIIHCDLKPENVLIKSYSRCEIKVIDLGSSCFETDNLCLYVQSRSYRAPEVILGLSYGPKIDIWSLGCIMAELCSGEVLFPNDGVVMLLARTISLLGPIDLEMLLRGEETHKYFTKEFDLFHINEDTNQMEYIIPEKSSLEQHLPVSDAGFMDFLRYLLQINPRGRPTARQALEHPWLSLPYTS
ncbi:serine/threonine-protein kinase ppk5-like [Chenopodium quinoa]|uniref:serine/threonine-protein kinase ppk5-like n=1 Tax=Chenopodium quinoa TaxID=63459 RepID=UPI000B77B466|nr:serine/threonine-protein kinase ppk5-like [Chenopodium quinoa]